MSARNPKLGLGSLQTGANENALLWVRNERVTDSEILVRAQNGGMTMTCAVAVILRRI